MSAITATPPRSAPANPLETIRLTEREGPLWTGETVMRAMNISLQQLASLCQNNAILSVIQREELLFPSMQFIETEQEGRMAVSPYFRTLLENLPAPLTGMDRLHFMFTPILFDDERYFSPADYRHSYSASSAGAQEMMIITRHAAFFTRNKISQRRQ